MSNMQVGYLFGVLVTIFAFVAAFGTRYSYRLGMKVGTWLRNRRDITTFDRWLWNLRTNHPIGLCFFALAIGFVFFIPLVILCELAAKH